MSRINCIGRPHGNGGRGGCQDEFPLKRRHGRRNPGRPALSRACEDLWSVAEGGGNVVASQKKNPFRTDRKGREVPNQIRTDRSGWLRSRSRWLGTAVRPR